MIREHWKPFVCFVVLMAALSTLIVRSNVDVLMRGYPLPFLLVYSGPSDGTHIGWRISNLLITLGCCAAAGAVAIAATRLSMAARNWFFLGGGILVVVSVEAFTLWQSIERPITTAEKLERALGVAESMFQVMALGTLAAAVCFFVSFLKVSTPNRLIE